MALQLATREDILQFIASRNLRTNKRLGQHFLLDPRVLDATVDAAQVGKKDTVVEIGAGCGILTKKIVQHAGRVIALELDDTLIELLKREFDDMPQVQIEQADARVYQPHREPYKLVGNIPYYLTSPLLRHFLHEVDKKPQSLTLLIQKEVAERLCAAPPDMNMLALIVQLVAKPRIVMTVSKGQFFPPPTVESALVHIDLLEQLPAQVTPSEIPAILDVASRAFQGKRKQLRNSLAHSYSISKEVVDNILVQAHIDPTVRPEALDISAWISLTRNIHSDILKV